jgi:diguanylate cyclase (GGDEF)-like protein
MPPAAVSKNPLASGFLLDLMECRLALCLTQFKRRLEATVSKPRRIQRTALGIGPRIVLAFVLVFGIMGGLSLLLLKSSLLPTFDGIERRFAMDSAKRVISGFDEQLAAIAALNQDWGLWDELYFHIQRPSKTFERSNIGGAAMQTSNFNAVLILDRKGTTVGFGARELSNGSLPQADELLVPLRKRWKNYPLTSSARECGLAFLQTMLSAVCWGQVLHSDGSGPAIGTILMARELNAEALKTIAQNAGAAFTLMHSLIANDVSNESDLWTLSSFKYLQHNEVSVLYAPSTITLTYPLWGLDKSPLASVSMQLERSLLLQAQRVVTGTLLQMAAVTLITGLLLLAAVHFWLVRPITRLHKEVNALSTSRRWDSVLHYDRNDEIGALTQGINGLLSVLHDQVDALETLSSTDALTGLANRRHFDERLKLELGRMARRSARLSLLLVDVDHFKLYNDHYGHPKGDEILQQLGQLLQHCGRQQDLAARIGGEEFSLLLPDTDTAGARALSDKIRKGLEALNLLHAKSPTSSKLTVSIGVATWSSLSDGGATELIAQADKALYTAKNRGRDRTCVYGTAEVPL